MHFKHISIAGHTDALPYPGGERGYSNWDLSADRANAARRTMIEGGLAEDKVIRIVGLGSTVQFNPDDPLDPMNRRISIIVLNRRSEQAVRRDSPASVHTAGEAQDVLEGKRPDLIQGPKPEIRPNFATKPAGGSSRVDLTPTSPRGY